ncbi:MAG: DUF1080 domain-containing protein, partial [Verrucomicrobiota bacterium]
MLATPVAGCFDAAMRRLSLLLVLASLGSLFSHGQEKKPDPALVEGEASLARLAEVKFLSLFNGQNLEGWQGDTEGYIVEDGILVCQKGAKALETAKEYSDFVFQFEFKLTESGNNGLGIRVPSGGHAAYQGMELQILDHRGDRYHVAVEGGGRV